MSKTSNTNDTSKLDAKLENRVLTDSELEAVSGGRNDPYRGFSFRIDVSGIQRGGF